MKNDNLIISRINDRIVQCERGFYVTSTGFLDSHQQSLAVPALHSSPDVHAFLWGGYDEAERRIVVCMPRDYPLEYSDILSVLHIEIPKGSRELTHRDYLGSILSLGIERRVIGDILVRDNGADIICLSEISDFLLNEYRQIGRVEVLQSSIVGLDKLQLPEHRVQKIRDTVSSLRLDNVISSAFGLSRANAVKAIKSGIVAVNHLETLKPDQRIDEGAVLTLRGKGKAALARIGGTSKKDRIWIEIDRYK